MSDELKPCPFCGGDAELDTLRGYIALHSGLMGNQIAVYCRDCTADVSVCREDVPDITPEQVSEMWNHRAESQPELQALENCRLYAGRHRKEEWSAVILRFCAGGGATGSPLREAAPTVAEPVAWLIEHSGKFPGAEEAGRVSWLYVKPKDGGYGACEFGFTHDSNQALRFSRKEDADAVMTMHMGPQPPKWYSEPYSVTEHMWPAAAPPRAPQPPNEHLAVVVAEAMRRAWSLGQTYWRQADSESLSEQARTSETQVKFNELVDSTIAAITVDRRQG